MASPPKNDAWPPYRSDQQRLVFIRRHGRLRPTLGLVVTWPIAGTGGRFLVAFWDDNRGTPGLRMTWIERRFVKPIWVDPNWSVPGGAPWDR